MKWSSIPNPEPQPNPGSNPVEHSLEPIPDHPEDTAPPLSPDHPMPPPLAGAAPGVHHPSPGLSEHAQQLRIILPQNVSNCDDLLHYFQQRLGPGFDQIPFMVMQPKTYMELTQGKEALLTQMSEQDRAAADEIFVAFTGDDEHLYAIMTFNIETPNVGARAVDYIRKHQTTQLHRFWLAEMESLAARLQQLHRQWRRQSPLYHLLPQTETRHP